MPKKWIIFAVTINSIAIIWDISNMVFVNNFGDPWDYICIFNIIAIFYILKTEQAHQWIRDIKNFKTGKRKRKIINDILVDMISKNNR